MEHSTGSDATTPILMGLGTVDRAFALGERYWYAEGWWASAGTVVTAVEIEDEGGTFGSVPFQVCTGDRADARAALAHLGSGISVAGYRLIVACKPSRSALVRIRFDQAGCVTLDLSAHLASTTPAVVKRSAIQDALADVRWSAWQGGGDLMRHALGMCLGEQVDVNRLIEQAQGTVESWCRTEHAMVGTGWLANADGHAFQVGVLTGDGYWPVPAEAVCWYDRPVEQGPGRGLVFRCPIQDKEPVALCVTDEHGRSRDLPLPRSAPMEQVLDTLGRRYEWCLSAGAIAQRPQGRRVDFFDGVLDELLREQRRGTELTGDYRFGPAPARPVVNLMIPVGQCHPALMELQVLAMAADPIAQQQEFTFVSEPGAPARVVHAVLERLARMFALSMRLLVLSRPASTAMAYQVAARVCSGPNLLLATPDAVPTSRYWLGPMLQTLLETPMVAMVGVPYAPHAIGEQRWRNEPIGEWCDDLIERGSGVECGKAACVLVSASAFREAGGFDGQYHGDDFAYADLRRRLERAGYRAVSRRDVSVEDLGCVRSRMGVDVPMVFRERDARRFLRQWGELENGAASAWSVAPRRIRDQVAVERLSMS